jgi:hypothetical protein
LMRGRALMRDIRADVIKDVMLDHGGRALMRAAGGGGGQVAGDAQGITAFQLDIKCEGLSPALLARALAQASPGTQGLARVESQGDWSRRAREALAVGGLWRLAGPRTRRETRVAGRLKERLVP